jgi:hypothetical protein
VLGYSCPEIPPELRVELYVAIGLQENHLRVNRSAAEASTADMSLTIPWANWPG